MRWPKQVVEVGWPKWLGVEWVVARADKQAAACIVRANVDQKDVAEQRRDSYNESVPPQWHKFVSIGCLIKPMIHIMQ